jgi:hypothetical protein
MVMRTPTPRMMTLDLERPAQHIIRTSSAHDGVIDQIKQPIVTRNLLSVIICSLHVEERTLRDHELLAKLSAI